MDDLVLAKLNRNVFESNFGVYPTPPLSPLSFHPHDSYFPETYLSLFLLSPYCIVDGVNDSVRVIDRQHEALKLINGTNHLKKLRNPKSILDIGCGKGAWTVDIASEFTTADEVVGVDINPSLPQQYPSNCRFEVPFPNPHPFNRETNLV
jgi:SAM-dependent methyltransferase